MLAVLLQKVRKWPQIKQGQLSGPFGVHFRQDWNRVLVSLISWPEQLLSLWETKIPGKDAIFVEFTDSLVEFTHFFVDVCCDRFWQIYALFCLFMSRQTLANLRIFCQIYGLFCWIYALFVDFCRDRRLRAFVKILAWTGQNLSSTPDGVYLWWRQTVKRGLQYDDAKSILDDTPPWFLRYESPKEVWANKVYFI